MTEQQEAYHLAHRLLDEPGADLDDELRILSRQFLRALEGIEILKNRLTGVQKAEALLRAGMESQSGLMDTLKQEIRNLRAAREKLADDILVTDPGCREEAAHGG